jgi:hypothetical protein
LFGRVGQALKNAVAEHFRLAPRGEITTQGDAATLKANPDLVLSSYLEGGPWLVVPARRQRRGRGNGGAR